MDPQYAYQSAPANFMPMMAGGGLAAAAQQLQGQGRNGDSMLVHMTPGEVKGLQALAMSQGGSLTINPTTGLPEASILRALLPIALGFALGPAGLGMSAGMAGLTVGGITTLATGSLKQGIMAGLGAYGGGGIGQGLTAAGGGVPTGGAPVPAEAAAEIFGGPGMAGPAAAPQPAFDYAGVGYNTGVVPAPAGVGPGVNPGVDFFTQTPTSPTVMAPPQPVAAPTVPTLEQTAASIRPGVGPGIAPPTPTATAGTGTPTAFDTAKKGLGEVFKSGEAGAKARAAFSGATPFGTIPAAAAPIASAAMEPPKGPEPNKAYIRPYKFAWNQDTQSYEPSPTLGDTAERRYFSPTFSPEPIYEAAQGGEVNPFDEMTEDGGYEAGGDVGLKALAKKRKSVMGDKLYRFSQDRRDQSMEAAIEQNFAKGGLGAALPPRFLSGGGDGMSDSIKANIDGKQEARLADGEFVVPADVVSHLGNGSSKAGAKKLYAMMDKIRKARTGSKRQAPEVNAAKYMPA